MESLDLLNNIKEFLYYCEFEALNSKNTVRSLKSDLHKFNEYVKKSNRIEKISDIDLFDLREYVIELKNDNQNKSSINRKISSLKTFFKYLKSNGKIKKNLAQFINTMSFERKEPKILSSDEIDNIRNSIDITSVSSLRDRLIVELLYSSGIKAQELLSLSENVFDLEKREVRVSNLKNQRTVFYSEITKFFFEKYIDSKKNKFKENYKEEIVFVNGSGNRLSDRSLRRILEKYGMKAKVEGELTPQTFRDTFAVIMLKNGMTREQLQALLGYTTIESTKNYENKSNE